MPLRVELREIKIWNETLEPKIQEYEKEELHKGEIVFYGPSYFTRWAAYRGETPMREVLLGKSGKQCVVNRGFGSSCAEHQLYYYPRMVRPLEPKVLVYESYGNSLAFGYTEEETFELAQRVVSYALADFPGIHVYLCGPHYSLKNRDPESIEGMKKYAGYLKKFAEETPGCYYIDIMSYESLQRDDIFVEDGIHYNSLGYKLYAEVYKDALKEEFDRF